MDTSKISCPVELTMAVIGDKWKIFILRDLLQGTKRFGELQRSIHGVSQKMLTQQLRSMEADGIISRTVYPQVPPKVEYSLTELGWSLAPVISAMTRWGMEYRRSYQVPVAEDFPTQLSSNLFFEERPASAGRVVALHPNKIIS